MRPFPCSRFGLLTVFVGFAGPVAAQARSLHPADSLVHRYFERQSQFGFSGSVLVARGAEVVFAGGFGEADRETGRAFVSSTVLDIGSITKMFTAAAVLRLAGEGRLRIGDAISAYLDPVPADKAAITIEQLLTHTAGLKRNGVEGGDLNLAASRDSVLADALASPLQAPPGTRYSYSNLGYSLLAMIVERASGVPYERYLREHLLWPTGMYRTGYLLPTLDPRMVATGYRGDKRLGPFASQHRLPDGPTWNLRGNGGLQSDAWDMLRWYLAIRRGSVLEESAVAAMIAPHVDEGDSRHFYGYGLEVSTDARDHRLIFHTGGNGYFGAGFYWMPDDDLFFFVGSNDASNLNVTRIASAVQAILLDQPFSMPPELVPVADSVLAGLAGRYPLSTGDTIVVRAEPGHLAVRAIGADAMRLVIGGDRSTDDAEVKRLAERSANVVRAEFRGDFQPQFEAMGGITPVATLRRYHQYDRADWDAKFGALQHIEVAASAGALDEVQVVLRLVFEHGAAAQVHTWRGQRLTNVSVIPDWHEFEFGRSLYPVGEGRFESFETGSDLRVRASLSRDRSDGRTLEIRRPGIASGTVVLHAIH